MQPDQNAEWVVLKEWSGETGTTVTEKFTTTERVFRVSWSSSELDRGGLLDVYVWSDAKRLIMLSAGLQDHVKKASSGTFLVNAAPGLYYLEVRGTGVKWRVAVERRKS